MKEALGWMALITISLGAASVLRPQPAHAQRGGEGAIVGYVFDQTGNPLPGVKILATSPTQIGGTKTTYTNEEGAFRLRQLFPGTFQVTASAPKLKTVVQKDIRVGISAAAEVNLVMEIQAKGVEEVTVVERAPTVSTTTTNVKEVYDLDYVENLPMSGPDQIFGQMVGQIGGAVGRRIRGGANNQTIFVQDGFDMRDQYPVTKASAAYEIQSAGYGADNATASGGLVNLVTKTGSNKWEVELNASVENNTLRIGKDARDGQSNFYYVVRPAVAGPIIKDRLWFAFAFESHLLGRGRESDIEGILPTPRPHIKFINKGTLKITYQINARNKLSFLNNVDSAANLNMKRGIGILPEAQQNRKAGLSGLWGLIWESVLTDDLVFRSQAAYSKRPQYWYPRLCEGKSIGDCALEPGIINRFPRRVETNNAAVGCTGTGECTAGSAQPYRRLDLDVLQAANQLQWFLDSKTLGEHSLKLSHQFYTEKETTRLAQPGNYYEEWNGEVREARVDFYSNDPRVEEPRYGWWIASDVLYRSVASLSDAWKPTRHLTITPALSHVWASGKNSAGDTVISSSGFAPSVALAWGATHDGRTVVRGSYSQYVDMQIRTPVLHTIGDPVTKRCLWNADDDTFDRNCVYRGGPSRNTFGLPCGPTGVDATGKPCYEPLSIPRTYEYTLGAEREIVQGVGLSIDLVLKQYNNQYEQSETNRIWNQSGSEVISYKNGRAETIMNMGTPDEAQRIYRGVTVALNRRQGRVRAYASYTLSKLTGTVFNGSNNRWGDIPGRDIFLDGYLPDDRRHDVKASMSWAVTKWLSLGARYQFGSGFPYNRLFRNASTGSFEDYRAPQGLDPGNNINDPGDDRELRYPPIQEVNFQTRFSLLPLLGQKIDVYADLLNVLNLRTPTSYGQNDGQDYGIERGWMQPFRIRLGLDYRY